MMLTQLQENATLSGKVVTNEFDIGDPAMIIEYMSKTIYSDPIKILIQEYLSNARDAHIEIGTPNVPIEIKLPNKFDPSFKIKDFGLGITPERMKNVFIRYGISTKRTNNKEAGGFGLGAKSGWSYTDSFDIRTISNENGVNTLRCYSAIKERGKAPRLVEFGDPIIIDMNDPNTPEENKKTGTTISIMIKPGDEEAFKRNIIEITEFWNVRPKISGSQNIPEYRNTEWAYEGSNWKISYVRGYYENGFVCIDGIPYPIKNDAIYNAAENAGVKHMLQSRYVLFFNVGELSVSLSRESLHYDDQTINNIVKRLVELHTFLTNEIKSKIENASSLWEANIELNKCNSVFNFHSFGVNVTWQGIKVFGGSLPCINGNIREYFKDPAYNRIKSKRRYDIPFIEKSHIVINDDDTNGISTAKIATLMDLYPNSNIYVVTIFDINEWNTKVNFDKYSKIMLSTIPKKKMPRNISINTNTGPKSPRYSMKNVISLTKDNEMGVDLNYKSDSGIYVIACRYNISNSKFDRKKDIKNILTCLDDSSNVFIIPNRYANKLNNKFIPFDEYIKTKIEMKIKEKEFINYINVIKEKSFSMSHILSHDLMKIVFKIKNELINTELKEWIEFSEQLNVAENDNNSLIIRYANMFGIEVNETVTSNIRSIFDKFNEKLSSFNNIFNRTCYYNYEENIQNAGEKAIITFLNTYIPE